MPKIINLKKDKKNRQYFAEKPIRRNKFVYIFGQSVEKQQKYIFKTFCRVTGAGHSVYSKFQLSRHIFRKYAGFGFIPGIRAASW